MAATTLWEGYEARYSGGEFIIQPTGPNPAGDPPLASMRLLVGQIEKYRNLLAKRLAEESADAKARDASRQGLALGFLKLMALFEVRTSGKFPGKPNAHRPHREAIEKLLNVKSRVVVDRAPGQSEFGYKSDFSGKEPGRKELKEFDAYMAGVIGSLEQMKEDIATRERDGAEEPVEQTQKPVQPPQAAEEPAPANPPAPDVAEGRWVKVKGDEIYQLPGVNPPGDPPFECLKQLCDMFEAYANGDAAFRAKIRALIDGAHARIKDRYLAKQEGQLQAAREWLKRGDELLRKIAEREVYTFESFRGVNNPYSEDRKNLETYLSARVKVFRDEDKKNEVGCKATVYPEKDRASLEKINADRDGHLTAIATAFRIHMNARVKALPKMRARVDSLRGSQAEPAEP
jgi:hypothetical protein